MLQSQTPRLLASLRAVQAFIHESDRRPLAFVEELVRRGAGRQG
jgi:hypothetical protein